MRMNLIQGARKTAISKDFSSFVSVPNAHVSYSALFYINGSNERIIFRIKNDICFSKIESP